jgi:hypothetical protein
MEKGHLPWSDFMVHGVNRPMIWMCGCYGRRAHIWERAFSRYLPMLDWYIGECMVSIIIINNGNKNLPVGIKIVISVKY